MSETEPKTVEELRLALQENNREIDGARETANRGDDRYFKDALATRWRLEKELVAAMSAEEERQRPAREAARAAATVELETLSAEIDGRRALETKALDRAVALTIIADAGLEVLDGILAETGKLETRANRARSIMGIAMKPVRDPLTYRTIMFEKALIARRAEPIHEPLAATSASASEDDALVL